MGLLFSTERRSSAGMTFPEPVIPPFLGADEYGRVSTRSDPDTALTIPTVWACVSLLANAVAMLPLGAFRRTDGIPKQLPDPPFLTSPSAGLTQSEWLQSVMVSLLLRGNAYGRISARDNFMRPTQIDLLSPDKMMVGQDAAGGITYSYNNKGIQTDLAPSDVWHARGMTMPGAKVGMSPITYAAMTMGVDLGSRQFASEYFSGGGIPKAMLMSDRDLDQEQSRGLKEKFMAAAKRREPIVMGAGLSYKTIQVTPEESQFLATQTFNVAQIARFFGVPAEMVGGSSGNSNTYANVEQRGIEFLTYSVGPWLKRLEDCLFPLFASPVYVRFDTAALLRTDAETSAKIDVQLIAGKIKTPSEIRNDRQLPPMTPAQKVEADMVPLTVTPLGGAKALPTLKEPPGATAPVPTDDQTPTTQQGAPSAV